MYMLLLKLFLSSSNLARGLLGVYLLAQNLFFYHTGRFKKCLHVNILLDSLLEINYGFFIELHVFS